MSESTTLRIAATEQEQATFPWMDRDPNRVLALPPDDVEFWRNRSDYRNVQWSVLRFKLANDQRYCRMMIEAERAGYSTTSTFACLVLMASELACRSPVRETSPLGVGEHDLDLPLVVQRRWGFPDVERPNFERTLDLAIKCGFFRILDTSIAVDVQAYPVLPLDEKRERARSRTNAHVRLPTIPTSTDDTDRPTDVAPAPAQRQATELPETPPRAATTRKQGAGDLGGDDATSNDDARKRFQALKERCREWRRAACRSKWPRMPLDDTDLLTAFGRAAERGRLQDLAEVLKHACEVMDSGGGIRTELRRHGYL